MSNEGYARPAIISGIIAGLLSTVPFINLVNLLCCLLVIIGGVIGVYLLSTKVDRKITYGDGAIVGFFSGLVAAVISTIIHAIFLVIGLNIAMIVLERLWDIIPDFEYYGDIAAAAKLGAGFVVLCLLSSILLFAFFGAVGGIIGTAMFAKKK